MVVTPSCSQDTAPVEQQTLVDAGQGDQNDRLFDDGTRVRVVDNKCTKATTTSMCGAATVCHDWACAGDQCAKVQATAAAVAAETNFVPYGVVEHAGYQVLVGTTKAFLAEERRPVVAIWDDSGHFSARFLAGAKGGAWLSAVSRPNSTNIVTCGYSNGGLLVSELSSGLKQLSYAVIADDSNSSGICRSVFIAGNEVFGLATMRSKISLTGVVGRVGKGSTWHPVSKVSDVVLQRACGTTFVAGLVGEFQKNPLPSAWFGAVGPDGRFLWVASEGVLKEFSRTVDCEVSDGRFVVVAMRLDGTSDLLFFSPDGAITAKREIPLAFLVNNIDGIPSAAGRAYMVSGIEFTTGSMGTLVAATITSAGVVLATKPLRKLWAPSAFMPAGAQIISSLRGRRHHLVSTTSVDGEQVRQFRVVVDAWLHTSCEEAAKCGTLSYADCTDTDPCTKDWCDPATGCTHDPWPDGTTCGSGKVCLAGTCGSGG